MAMEPHRWSRTDAHERLVAKAIAGTKQVSMPKAIAGKRNVASPNEAACLPPDGRRTDGGFR